MLRSCGQIKKARTPLRAPCPFPALNPVALDLERTAAAAGRLHLRVVELEARAFERLDVIHFGAIQVQHAGLIYEDFEVAVVVGLVQHVGLVFEGHRVAESATTAADHRSEEHTSELQSR